MRPALAATLLAVALPALSACEASIGAETQVPYTPGNGVWADSDHLQLRSVVAVAPENGTATLVGTILNQGRTADALVDVSIPNGGSTFSPSPLPLPADGVRVLGVDTSLGRATMVALEGRRLRPGLVVPVTFEFRRAGTVTLDVLVVPDTGPYATVPAPTADAEASPSPTDAG